MANGDAPKLLELLTATARELVEVLDASGCALSRAIGDVLVLVAEHTEDGRSLQLGQGYLVSDFPETQALVSDRVPRVLSLGDAAIDAAEADLLRELGYDSLLMLPLEVGDDVWGLVEIYGDDGRAFSGKDVARVAPILARTRELLGRLP